MDRAIRRAGGPVHGLENCLCERGDGAATPARRGVSDAVRADVQAVGDSNYRGQFSPGERPGGAQPRHAPGPAGEETAAEKDPSPGEGQRVTEERIAPGPRPALCADGSFAGRLPP